MYRHLVRVVCCAAGLALAPEVVCAQRVDSLTAGARIRVQRVAPVWTSVRGTYVSRDSLTFVLDPGDRSGAFDSIPMPEVLAVEISVHRRTSGQAFGRGAGRGALVGIGASAVLMTLATVADARDNGESYIPARVAAGVFSVLLTGVTTLVGGAIGSAHRDDWRRVPFRP